MHDINLSLEYGDNFIGIGKDGVVQKEKKEFFTKENLKKIYGIDFETFENNNKTYVQAVG